MAIAGAPALPMLYRELVSLDNEKHLGYGLRPRARQDKARTANVVPVGISEFAQASQQYPIVFGPAGEGIPIIITAPLPNQNFFVDAEGYWLEGAYMPAWLRRYPFWPHIDMVKNNVALWFDPSAEQVVPLQDFADARPLFDYQGSANLALQEVVQFCQRCQTDTENTMSFALALEQHRLLVNRHVTFDLPNGKPYTLSGFRMIDMDAYYGLPDTVLAQWVRNGWSNLVGLHQLSQNQWQRLVMLLGQSAGQQPS